MDKENLSKYKNLYHVYTCPEGLAMAIYPIVYSNAVYVYCKKPGAGYELECRHTDSILDPEDPNTVIAVKNLVEYYIPPTMYKFDMSRRMWSRGVFLWGPLKNLEELSEWAKQNYISYAEWHSEHKLLDELNEAKKRVEDLTKQCAEKGLI